MSQGRLLMQHSPHFALQLRIGIAKLIELLHSKDCYSY
jgi:hypothetical protein